MSSVSPIEHTAIGAFAGFVEVSIMQPTVTIKNALQEGRALPRTPIALYRGYLVQFSAHSAALLYCFACTVRALVIGDRGMCICALVAFFMCNWPSNKLPSWLGQMPGTIEQCKTTLLLFV